MLDLTPHKVQEKYLLYITAQNTKILLYCISLNVRALNVRVFPFYDAFGATGLADYAERSAIRFDLVQEGWTHSYVCLYTHAHTESPSFAIVVTTLGLHIPESSSNE